MARNSDSKAASVEQSASAARFERDGSGLYIGGRWRARPDAEMMPLVDPSTEQVYAHAVVPTIADADEAVLSARRAFDSRVWRDVPVGERAVIISRAYEIVLQSLDEIAEIAAFEIGAPVQITRMMTGVVGNVIAGMSEIAVSEGDVEHGNGLWEFEIQRDPAGVVVDVVPWNSPFSGTMMKSAQALLAGCSVISKPPPTAPFAVLAWARALEAAGLPDGVFGVLAAGAEVSERLVTHPGVDLVVFTGGTAVGRRVAELCGRNLKRVILELGGKSAAVVLQDADMQLAVDSVASGVYFNSGQICSALTRLVVPRTRIDEICELLRQKAEGVVIGNPLDESTTMGPMATEDHYRRVLDRVRAGENEGAKRVYGGIRPDSPDLGWYVTPALFIADNEMNIAREEVFGPVATVIGYDSEEEAIAIANDSTYGLGGSVFSADHERAHRVASKLDTGSVTINGYTTNLLAPRNPHKSSGIGSVTGVAGYRSFSSTRLINLQAGAKAWRPTELFADNTN
ncbi:aldehyde dehydrogenase family protein [Rhodococcus globerulus]|uniref:aldehyde dehydrogenase (NAD(+)) n=1 Tax=Rhodococcus globerulus TaxID=33008 RepID=A0ABU4C4A3_RHOGO|nr:aldehyde dehydrogenase family protein [Rhodococcus globerulus]MDV6271336.1 aldehyde dehydrogenase family protein [Rhodococcus globerulus]